ncbi:proline-serine-threonine phosphatase-interacting protein 2-like [Guaruba guarouba]
MEEFREKQKLYGKKRELRKEAIIKTRHLQYKKTMEAKRLYEQCCRDKDEAEQAVHHNRNVVTEKQQQNVYRSRCYQQSLTTLEKIREEWQKEHDKGCEVKADKFLHVAVPSSGCPLLAAGVWNTADLLSLCCPGSEAAACVAANPVCVLRFPSAFRVPPLQGFHYLFCFYFSFHYLFKLTEPK